MLWGENAEQSRHGRPSCACTWTSFPSWAALSGGACDRRVFPDRARQGQRDLWPHREADGSSPPLLRSSHSLQGNSVDLVLEQTSSYLTLVTFLLNQDGASPRLRREQSQVRLECPCLIPMTFTFTATVSSWQEMDILHPSRSTQSSRKDYFNVVSRLKQKH